MDSINDILSSLSSEDIDSLKSMAQSIFGSDEQPQPQSKQSPPDMSVSPEMLMKISSVMNMMNNSHTDDRYKLIEARKPNLSQKRQKKADEAMQMLKVLEILPLITELYKGGDDNADG